MTRNDFERSLKYRMNYILGLIYFSDLKHANRPLHQADVSNYGSETLTIKRNQICQYKLFKVSYTNCTIQSLSSIF